MRRRATLTEGQQNELRRFIKKTRKGHEVRRAQAVLLYHEGMPGDTVRAVTGYGVRHSFALSAAYRERGLAALLDRREAKPKELLTRKQRDEIVELLKTKTPRDFDYETPYWTSAILGALIEKRFGVRYKSKTSYYLLFRSARFTYHLPPTRYHEQDPKEVRRWRKTAEKRLAEAERDPSTVILAEDEMVLTTATTVQKVWLPRGDGQAPVVEVSNGGRKRRSVYGFLNLQTGTEHAWKTEFQNMHVTVSVLKDLRALYPDKRLLLLWDSAGWHKGSSVQEWIAADGRVEIFHFPRYTPEENPQEHVWKSGRSQVTHNRFIENIDTATDDFVRYLNATKFPYSLFGITAKS